MSVPSANDLGKVVTSARARRVIYTVYVVAVLLLGAVQVAYAASYAGQPEWVDIATAVMLYLGVPVGGLAAANTSSGGKYAAK